MSNYGKIIMKPKHGIEIRLNKPIPTDLIDREEYLSESIGNAILRLYLDGVYKEYFDIEVIE
jgi:hypothetical protein